jgi:hypothetical protein
LKTVNDNDEAVFAGTDGSVWNEIESARDILNPPDAPPTANNMGRFPVYVKSNEDQLFDSGISSKVTERLIESGFTKATDERHAAIIFKLVAHRIENKPDEQLSDGRNIHVMYAIVYASSFYNATKHELFPSFITDATGRSETRGEVESCALLSASLSAADKFIGFVNATERTQYITPYRC